MRHTRSHDDPKLVELVNKFEDASLQGEPVFFEHDEFSDLIDYYESEFLPERALEVCKCGAVQYPYTSTFHLRQAMILLDIGQKDGILDLLDQAESLSPVALEPKLLRAEALAAAGRFTEASRILKDLQAKVILNTDCSLVYLYQALLFEKQEDYPKMFETLKRALEEDSSNQEALDRMWICVELSKNYEESILFHEKLLDQDPYSYKSWYNLGHALSYCGRYEEAADAFEYSYLIQEDFEFAYRDCAEICLEIQDFNRALKCYSEVMERFDVDADLLLRIGQCYMATERSEIARKFFQKAIRLDNHSDESYYHLGECQLEAGEYKAAIKTFKQAIRLEDRREEYFSGLAEAYYQVDDLEKAELHFQSATEIAPELSEYWIRYVVFLLDTGRLKDAFETLDQAEEHAVGTEFIYCRVCLLIAAKHRSEALFLLEEALMEDFSLRSELFNILPELELDLEIQAVIETFRPT
ncbi:MAG: tetratricopeptide repeat protein [Saprospiraceae bacterium]|nr:tetratricopeptide repeat protein [Saprospiraceae bacterium]